MWEFQINNSELRVMTDLLWGKIFNDNGFIVGEEGFAKARQGEEKT